MFFPDRSLYEQIFILKDYILAFFIHTRTMSSMATSVWQYGQYFLYFAVFTFYEGN